MTIETLSGDAITRLVDRAMIAEAEKRAVRKSLAAKTNEVLPLEVKRDKTKASGFGIELHAQRPDMYLAVKLREVEHDARSSKGRTPFC